MPKLMEIMKPWQWLLAIFFWSLFVAIVDRHSVANESQFIIKFIARFIQTSLTLLPSFYLIDYLRPIFKRLSVSRASMYVLLILTSATAVTMMLVLLIMINCGWFAYSIPVFISTVVFNVVISAGFTVAALLIFLRRYREMNALKQSFEQKLRAQNDVLKARLAPHFFFNTINTLMSLIESDPARAADLLQHLGIQYVIAENGKEAVDRFSEQQPGWFQIIFMDLRMPVMNGMEAAAAIRRLPRQDAADVPIVAVTAEAYADIREQLMECGMTEYLAKPIQVEDIEKVLRKVL